MKKLATKLSNVAIALLFIAGLGILFYPSFSDAYNKWLFSRVVISYKEEILAYKPEEAEIILHQARAYNLQLHRGLVASETYTPIDYNSTLNLYNGMMGYIEISKIGVSLPIYHGTSDAVLQKGVGHLDWTSLPTGESGNHVVLTGHTGLPSAKLFTDVDQLGMGDSFVVRVLSEDFYYKICDIQVVLPTEVDSLERVVGRDLVTLVTCTPYGVNSHRLLVTGERYTPSASEIPTLLMEETVESPAVYLGLFVLFLAVLVGICLLIMKWKSKKKKATASSVPLVAIDDMLGLSEDFHEGTDKMDEISSTLSSFDGKGERKERSSVTSSQGTEGKVSTEREKASHTSPKKEREKPETRANPTVKHENPSETGTRVRKPREDSGSKEKGVSLSTETTEHGEKSQESRRKRARQEVTGEKSPEIKERTGRARANTEKVPLEKEAETRERPPRAREKISGGTTRDEKVSVENPEETKERPRRTRDRARNIEKPEQGEQVAEPRERLRRGRSSENTGKVEPKEPMPVEQVEHPRERPRRSRNPENTGKVEPKEPIPVEKVENPRERPRRARNTEPTGTEPREKQPVEEVVKPRERTSRVRRETVDSTARGNRETVSLEASGEKRERPTRARRTQGIEETDKVSAEEVVETKERPRRARRTEEVSTENLRSAPRERRKK